MRNEKVTDLLSKWVLIRIVIISLMKFRSIILLFINTQWSRAWEDFTTASNGMKKFSFLLLIPSV